MRVNQLDALQLDKELNVMLGYQFRRIFQYFHPGVSLCLDGLLGGLGWTLLVRGAIHPRISQRVKSRSLTPFLHFLIFRFSHLRLMSPRLAANYRTYAIAMNTISNRASKRISVCHSIH